MTVISARQVMIVLGELPSLWTTRPTWVSCRVGATGLAGKAIMHLLNMPFRLPTRGWLRVCRPIGITICIRLKGAFRLARQCFSVLVSIDSRMLPMAIFVDSSTVPSRGRCYVAA